MSRLGDVANGLYRGEVSYDFVGRRKTWYAISAVLILISVLALGFRGLTLGIEFRGGAEFRLSGSGVSQGEVLEVVEETVGGEVVVQSVGRNGIRAQTEKLTADQVSEVRDSLAQRFDIAPEDVSTQFVGPSWGEDISKKALRALVIFLALLAVFLSLYFEWKMAFAAMVALVHDLVITVGIYALVGFEVTPATVIGFLTILGYSLYDTVVVFDKVRENTVGLAGGSRMTYSEAANLAVNQTLVRSINTSIIALLPIGAILFAGAFLLGTGPLKDLSLALFVGVAAGTYSSIFIATPLLAAMKEREPGMQALARRVAARRSGASAKEPAAAGKAAPKRSAGTAAPRAQVSDDAADVADVADDETATAGEPAEPAAAGAKASSSSRATPGRRPSGGNQRSQPRRSGKSRPGGKKRR